MNYSLNTIKSKKGKERKLAIWESKKEFQIIVPIAANDLYRKIQLEKDNWFKLIRSWIKW